jgi:hypothetical protein
MGALVGKPPAISNLHVALLFLEDLINGPKNSPWTCEF